MNRYKKSVGKKFIKQNCKWIDEDNENEKILNGNFSTFHRKNLILKHDENSKPKKIILCTSNVHMTYCIKQLL